MIVFPMSFVLYLSTNIQKESSLTRVQSDENWYAWGMERHAISYGPNSSFLLDPLQDCQKVRSIFIEKVVGKCMICLSFSKEIQYFPITDKFTTEETIVMIDRGIIRCRLENTEGNFAISIMCDCTLCLYTFRLIWYFVLKKVLLPKCQVACIVMKHM